MPGETIVREGDPADRFYIIECGQVTGTQSAPAGDMRALTMQPGDYFGEVGLLATRRRTATVQAVSEVRVVSLDRAQFQALVDASANPATLVDQQGRCAAPQRTRRRAERRKLAAGPNR